jgi:hypothetical protein
MTPQQRAHEANVLYVHRYSLLLQRIYRLSLAVNVQFTFASIMDMFSSLKHASLAGYEKTTREILFVSVFNTRFRHRLIDQNEINESSSLPVGRSIGRSMDVSQHDGSRVSATLRRRAVQRRAARSYVPDIVIVIIIINQSSVIISDDFY